MQLQSKWLKGRAPRALSLTSAWVALEGRSAAGPGARRSWRCQWKYNGECGRFYIYRITNLWFYEKRPWGVTYPEIGLLRVEGRNENLLRTRNHVSVVVLVCRLFMGMSFRLAYLVYLVYLYLYLVFIYVYFYSIYFSLFFFLSQSVSPSLPFSPFVSLAPSPIPLFLLHLKS